MTEKILPSGGAARGSILACSGKAALAYRTSFPWAAAVLSDFPLLQIPMPGLAFVPKVSNSCLSQEDLLDATGAASQIPEDWSVQLK